MQAVVGRHALEKQAASTNTLSRFETEVLVTEDNLRGLGQMNAEWIDHAMARTRHQRIILDMDSSESPVYGEQEGATYNGHFETVCYHPLFLFNEFGDCERAMLRSGNVHSTERWREVLEPIVERYKKRGIRLLFSADSLGFWGLRYSVRMSRTTVGLRDGDRQPCDIEVLLVK